MERKREVVELDAERQMNIKKKSWKLQGEAREIQIGREDKLIWREMKQRRQSMVN